MTRLAHALTLFSWLLVALAADEISPKSLSAKHLKAAKRWKPVARGRSTGSAGNTRRDTTSVKSITFTNPEASSGHAWDTTRTSSPL